MLSNDYHIPVLVDAVIRYLQPKPGGIYVDGTIGGGGHAEEILMKSSPSGRVIGFDVDSDAIAFARQRLEGFGGRVTLIGDNASNMRKRLSDAGVTSIDGFMLDLGVSSHQIGSAERGFSFQQESRIDMRMGDRTLTDGWTVVNTYTRDRLAEILWKFGEERAGRRIAERIVERREEKTIDTTAQLAEIVRSAARSRNPQQTLARVFQAIRLEVNKELEHLAAALQAGMELLTAGGRIVVISYHSLEDRIVKEFFREQSKRFVPSGTKLLPDRPTEPRMNVLTRKPVVPAPGEVAGNVRSRSAKLRAAEKL